MSGGALPFPGRIAAMNLRDARASRPVERSACAACGRSGLRLSFGRLEGHGVDGAVSRVGMAWEFCAGSGSRPADGSLALLRARTPAKHPARWQGGDDGSTG